MCASGVVTALGISDKLKLYHAQLEAQPQNFVINECCLIVLEYTILLTCPQFLLNLYFSMILHKVNFKNKLLLSLLSFQTTEINGSVSVNIGFQKMCGFTYFEKQFGKLFIL